MKEIKSFASDNNAGVHPLVMKAMEDVNPGHVVAYGDDPYTRRAVEDFKKIFGIDVHIFFVFGGTGANVVGLQTMTSSYNAIICSDEAHINCDEAGAPEKFTGGKLLPLHSRQGKITVGQMKPLLAAKAYPHQSEPSGISITQATEVGTLYTPGEVKEICDFAHSNHLFVHMDGARIANAAATLNGDYLSITRDAGVDILSFGATKNGGMYGEAVIIFNEKLVDGFEYYRKQSMQLASKMRYISAQFSAILKEDLWLKNAAHSNRMAQKLAAAVKDIQGIEVVYPVEANGVFARIPSSMIKPLQEKFFFYIWNENESVVRWMTSFDTTEEDVNDFVAEIKRLSRKLIH